MANEHAQAETEVLVASIDRTHGVSGVHVTRVPKTKHRASGLEVQPLCLQEEVILEEVHRPLELICYMHRNHRRQDLSVNTSSATICLF